MSFTLSINTNDCAGYRRRLYLRPKWVYILIGSLLAAASGGCICAKKQLAVSEEIERRSRLYQEDHRYKELKWLETNALHKGMTKQEVIDLFGHPSEPYVGNPEKIWMYSSEREVPEGHLLLIYFDDKKVRDSEWVSE